MLIRREIRDVPRAMAGPRLTVIVPRARLTRQIGGSVFAVDPATYPPLAAPLPVGAPTAPTDAGCRTVMIG